MVLIKMKNILSIILLEDESFEELTEQILQKNLEGYELQGGTSVAQKSPRMFHSEIGRSSPAVYGYYQTMVKYKE